MIDKYIGEFWEELEEGNIIIKIYPMQLKNRHIIIDRVTDCINILSDLNKIFIEIEPTEDGKWVKDGLYNNKPKFLQYNALVLILHSASASARFSKY